ncbi:MAG TPA: glucuronyl hydrolase [Micrococcales bacterium]|uniref:glycoside hydrolase family 88 protein n=1 Tax=Miniimonas arenae TaxID=676201 RepID=UPI000EC31905|nr:glycoside hydrolase family 88 protein [Miniimonas arenae]HCX84679.1 glucuronyl hydrolase [Micrococcales bacterium]
MSTSTTSTGTVVGAAPPSATGPRGGVASGQARDGAPGVGPAPDPEAWCKQAAATALRTLTRLRDERGDRYPGSTAINGRYVPRSGADGTAERDNVGWTAGFWPGMLWLADDLTGGDAFRAAAARHVPAFADRLARRADTDHHDLGFLYTLSCVAGWVRTGDEVARTTALAAADLLMHRFHGAAGILQAWGDLADPEQRGRAIVDSLMNTPLLIWASRESGDPRFRLGAERHVHQLADHIVRADGSTFHTFHWDPVTGAPERGSTAQGLFDGSVWARGQAWGVYGFALNARLLDDPALLAPARACADYLLAHLPEDLVPFWDLVLPHDSAEPRDSSAAAIAVCGLLELADQLEPHPDGGGTSAPAAALAVAPDRTAEATPSAALPPQPAPTAAAARYRDAAHRILASLARDYASDPDASDGLLDHSVYHRPEWRGVDEPSLWGDYFYLEGLVRTLDPTWRSHW